MDNKVMTNQDATPEIMVLKFADSKVPVFKETRNKTYIKYGDDDLYVEYLTYLFNKSSKHNAIITGKANYIFGGGFNNGNSKVNRIGETLNDITRKIILDTEIYGGYYLEVVWGFNGKISGIYHVDYTTIRKDKRSGFWFKEKWANNNSEDPIYINEFNPANKVGTQIYHYANYRPGTRYYPLPNYIGSNNYIEIDIEISKYYLSCIRNGMMPSKMIQFYTGEPPTTEAKREIERRIERKFTGSENAGRFFMVFNKNDQSKGVTIDDLSATDLDKHMVELNKLTQQEILSGHKVTSPMLFGIKTEGQLGGNNEMKSSYEAFVNTYAKPCAEIINREIGYLLSFSNFAGSYELQSIDPIGFQLDVKDVINILPKNYVFEKLGVPKEMWDLPNVGGTAITPIQQIQPAITKDIAVENDKASVNDAITNLTAKQHQQVIRIIRQYTKGQLTEAAAKALLRAGYGLSETDINDLLGIEQPIAMSFEEQENEILAMFDACGDDKEDWEILKSKRVSFNSEVEAEQDELVYIKEAFKTYDVSKSEASILEQIKKDPLIKPETIATVLGVTVAYVAAKIEDLIKRGYLERMLEKVGVDEVIKHAIPSGVDIAIPPIKEIPKATVKILYSYGGPRDSRNRPFCAKLLQLNRLYSRKQIEDISERLGYSVFDRRGGFWMHKDGTITPYCRHNWKSNIVVKKS